MTTIATVHLMELLSTCWDGHHYENDTAKRIEITKSDLDWHLITKGVGALTAEQMDLVRKWLDDKYPVALPGPSTMPFPSQPYKLVYGYAVATRLVDLEVEVQGFLDKNEGWELQGGIACDSVRGAWAQALVKKVEVPFCLTK